MTRRRSTATRDGTSPATEGRPEVYSSCGRSPGRKVASQISVRFQYANQKLDLLAGCGIPDTPGTADGNNRADSHILAHSRAARWDVDNPTQSRQGAKQRMKTKPTTSISFICRSANGPAAAPAMFSPNSVGDPPSRAINPQRRRMYANTVAGATAKTVTVSDFKVCRKADCQSLGSKWYMASTIPHVRSSRCPADCRSSSSDQARFLGGQTVGATGRRRTGCPRRAVLWSARTTGGLVARTGFEPVISALRGRCPWPLDERATRSAKIGNGWGSRIRTSAYRSRVCRPTTRRIPNCANFIRIRKPLQPECGHRNAHVSRAPRSSNALILAERRTHSVTRGRLTVVGRSLHPNGRPGSCQLGRTVLLTKPLPCASE